MKSKKHLTVIVSIAIICALVITGTAVAKYKFSSSSGKTVSEIVNRVNIEVSATEFTFSDVGKDGMLECRTVVTIEKTEPDFYGKLHSITLSGQEFGYTMYTASKSNGNAILPEEVFLPSENGKVSPLSWEVAFTVPYEEGKNTYELTLDINYSSGVKTNLAQRYLSSIPITIIVE